MASLFGSRTTRYRTAITWATLTTCAGFVCSILPAQSLRRKFSGKGPVPAALVGSEIFLLAIALGAGLTVIPATRLGFPISTTHGLTGAIIGIGVTTRQADFRVVSGILLSWLLTPPLCRSAHWRNLLVAHAALTL